MNLYSFYKKMYGCEKGIQNSDLFGKNIEQTNFSRIFTKHIVKSGYEHLEIDHDEHFRNIIEENELSDWEVNKISDAKKRKADIEKVFTEKWLDNYFGFKRPATSSMSRKSSFEEKPESLNSIGEFSKNSSLMESEM